MLGLSHTTSRNRFFQFIISGLTVCNRNSLVPSSPALGLWAHTTVHSSTLHSFLMGERDRQGRNRNKEGSEGLTHSSCCWGPLLGSSVPGSTGRSHGIFIQEAGSEEGPCPTHFLLFIQTGTWHSGLGATHS